MRYLKPHYYDKFVCTAGDCPDSCCAGWQIMIDETSLERYGNEKSEFGTRLRNSIDWDEECFYQNNRRCAFLNEENLCDLYKALGPDSLCDTCRMYPRHTEEYEGLRELSLSLRLCRGRLESFFPVKNRSVFWKKRTIWRTILKNSIL